MNRDSSVTRRHHSIVSAAVFIEKPEPCDFGQADELKICDWTNYFNATAKMAWKAGKGDTALWLGGPRTDHTLNTGEGAQTRCLRHFVEVERSSVRLLFDVAGTPGVRDRNI